MKRKVGYAFVIIGIGAVIGYGLFQAVQTRPLQFQGQVEAREVDVAAKVAGRIRTLLVHEGDKVSLGDVLFELESPELTAKLAQANAGRDAAAAMQSKADAGAREEEVRMAQFNWERAKSLYNEGLIAEQKHDEAATKAKAAADMAHAAGAQYDMAVNGARVEDKTAATALFNQAEGLVDEVTAYREETQLKAPISGEVSSVLIDVGELAPTGFPVITLVDLSDSWVILNVREDHLVHFKKGTIIMGSVPALGDQRIELSVYYIAPLADFATWRATRYSSGYDIKTFEVRLRPTEVIDDLRPGMSVLLEN